MVSSNSYGYDFDVHSKKNKLKKLKVLKDIGWLCDASELSDSYILYKNTGRQNANLLFELYLAKTKFWI